MTTAQSAHGRSSTFAALQHRNFRLMWVSLLISNAGTWLQTVALDALVYSMTGRALDLGLLGVVRAVTIISLAFFGGTIADRLDKRRLLMTTQTLMASLSAVLGLLAQFDALELWHVYVASFLGMVLLALDQPGRQALLPHLVPREHFMNAIALNSITFTGAAAIGPALAGPVVRLLGLPSGFYLNALSFFAVVYAVWAVRLPKLPPRQSEPVAEAVTKGLRYIFATPAILLLTSLLTVFAFFAMPYQSLLPVYAVKVFGGGVTEQGYLRAAAGLGALAGGMLLARLSGYRAKDRLVVTGGLGLCLALVLFALTDRLWAGLGLLFVTGASLTLFQSTIQTLLQHQTTDEMRGRVMSLFAISVIGMWPLGSGPMTWVADRTSAGTATIIGAAVAAAFLLAVPLVAPGVVRRLRGHA